MEWEEYLKKHEMEGVTQEMIHQLCYKAFMEGCKKGRALAIEAHRLRCHYLFGNRCMNSSQPKSRTQGLCMGNCVYIRRYEFELYKLEN